MRKALIPAILLAAMLAGCGDKEEEIEVSPARPREQTIQEEEPTPTESPEDPGVTADPEVINDTAFIPLRLENHRNVIYDKDEAYKTRFEGSYDELILEGDDYYALRYSLGELNKNIQEQVDTASTDYMEYAYEDSGFDDNWSYYYFRNCETTIDRADTQLVSLHMLWGDFAGGVHPNSYYETAVYDTESGKALKLDDIIDVSKKDEMLKLVGERALENNEGLEEMLFNDIDTALKDIDDNYSFTFSLDREGLTFYFSPYVIAAYAAGSTIVTVGYDEIPGLIKDEYRQLPADYFIEIDDTPHKLSDGREVILSSEYDNEDGMTVHITLDGKEYTVEDYGYESWFYLAEKNGKKYALRETQHDNDYMDVTVYDLNGNEVTEVDNVWASFGEGVFNPDCLPMSSRGELLSTYGMTDNYMLEDSGRLSQINDYFMIINNWEDDEWSLTLLQDLEVEGRDSFDSDDIYTMPLKKGEKIVFYATDDDTYVDFKTQGGSFVRIYVDYSDYPQKVNGIDIDELFDGIMFAG